MGLCPHRRPSRPCQGAEPMGPSLPPSPLLLHRAPSPALSLPWRQGLSPLLLPEGMPRIPCPRPICAHAGGISQPLHTTRQHQATALNPWPSRSFPLPSLTILHRFASAVDGKKGNGAKLLPGTTGSCHTAPLRRPGCFAGRFLCSLCDFFIQAIDIGFPAQGHFQSHKSAVLLYLLFLFSL